MIQSAQAFVAPFLDPLALGIVVGGTALALILRTPLRDVGRAIGALRTLGRKRFDAAPLLIQVEALSRIATKHGVMTLDRSVITDPDIAAAISDIVDGKDGATVAAHLSERQAARAERHRAASDFWASAAEIAPAMGMIGTLVGLVRMFLTMEDVTAIGGAMAIALLTTLYGAVLATLVAMPISTRLRTLARAEYIERTRLIAPLEALAIREAPRWRRQADAA